MKGSESLTAMIFGALGVAANVIIYQQKSGKKLLFYKLVSDVLWMCHYLCLSALSGAAIAAIGIIRETVFLNQERKWAQGKIWLLLFVILSLISAVFTWKSPFSLLPAFASVLSVFSFWKNKPELARALAFPISGSMLTYDIFCSSYLGIANEIFTLGSAVVGIFRHKEKKQSPKKAISK